MDLEFYHIYNRGVEKREIFCNEQDYYRAIHDIYEFNDINAAINVGQRFEVINRSPTSINQNQKPREKIIDLLCWSLMPNHYHFFSSPKIENGLVKFQQKFGTGYTNYFNLKYNRNGVLFQGKYKKVRVKDDAQVGQLVCYIHSNVLDLWKPGWKEKGLTHIELRDALKFLESKRARWSSHQDYLGIKNFPSLINNEFLFNFFGGSEGYRKFFTDWLKQYESNIKSIQKFILEK